MPPVRRNRYSGMAPPLSMPSQPGSSLSCCSMPTRWESRGLAGRMLPAALSRDRTAALYDDGSAALAGDHSCGHPQRGAADDEPSLTVAVALTHLVDGTFVRHSGGPLATVLTDPGRRAKDRQIADSAPLMINAGVLVAACRLSDSVAWAGISCPGYAALLFLPSAAGWPGCLVATGCSGGRRWSCARRPALVPGGRRRGAGVPHPGAGAGGPGWAGAGAGRAAAAGGAGVAAGGRGTGGPGGAAGRGSVGRLPAAGGGRDAAVAPIAAARADGPGRGADRAGRRVCPGGAA